MTYQAARIMKHYRHLHDCRKTRGTFQSCKNTSTPGAEQRIAEHAARIQAGLRKDTI